MSSRSRSLLVGFTAALLMMACASSPPRTVAQAKADRMLAHQVETALASDPTYFFRHVDVRADDGTVALSGYVWSDAAIRRAELVAGQVPGVTSVVDELALERAGGRSSR
jgi:osmotically-inducible protein OsmY